MKNNLTGPRIIEQGRDYRKKLKDVEPGSIVVLGMVFGALFLKLVFIAIEIFDKL